ncbi:MAG TPA: amino acid permease [Candidatus Eremiobacteraceae bacterium]
MPAASSSRPELIRALGITAAASLIICNIIGQGIFLKARAMTCNVGSPDLVVVAWVAAGILALCGALTFAELGALTPHSGGPYAFLRRAFGQPLAFAYGWTIFFLYGPATCAALAAGAAIFINLLTGGALDTFAIHIPLMHWQIAVTGTQCTGIAILAVVALINCAPVHVNGTIATLLTILKVLMVGGLTVAAFALGHGDWHHFAASGFGGSCAGIAASARGGATGFAAAMVGALYAYNGWAALTYVAGEVKNPGRAIPVALIASMMIVIFLYAAANVAYFYILSSASIAGLSPASSVGIEVVGTLFGPAARGIAAALLVVSVIATLHVSVMTIARIVYAYSGDGFFLPWLARVSEGGRVPVRSVLALGILAAVLVLLGSFDSLSDFEIFTGWVFYGLTGLSVFVLRRKEPDADRPYRVSGYPVVPALFVATTVWLLAEVIIAAPLRSLIGLGIIALAVPVYWLRARGTPAHAGPSIRG